MSEPSWASIEKGALHHVGKEVHVRTPINQGEGRNMHVTYLVVTGGIETRRRYSEFQWLYNRVLTEAPGAYVPIIPHKRTALIGEAKFSPEFVEERRMNLEYFLQGVFQIPLILDICPSLKVFLTAGDEELEAAKKEVEAGNPSLVSTTDMNDDTDNVAEAKKGFGNLLAKAKTATQTRLGNMELLETKEEDEIAAIKLYFSRLDVHVKEMITAAEKLIKTTSDRLGATNDLGVKVAEWKFSRDDFLDNTYGPEGRLLDDHQEIPKMMSAFAHFTEDIRLTMEHQSALERERLEQGLHKLALDVTAFKRSLNTRKKLQYAYTTKENQIKQLKKQLNVGKKNNIDKVSAELHDLEKSSSILKVKFEECSVRVTKEATRVRPIVEDKLKGCLREYANIQVSYGEKVRESWSKIMPSLNEEEDSGEPDATGKLTTIQLSEADSGAIHPPPAAAPPPLPPTESEFPDVLPNDEEEKPGSEE
eukprot:scaffold9264_cov123-Cylindrotheca_fusiformis.AAC.2